MPFIGNTPQTQSFAPAIDYFSGNGVTVTFTLSRPVVSVAQLTVAVDNVIQNPSSAFTVSGNSITFTSAPLSGTNNIWVEYTSLITTYAAISQDPSVIGDITATGGFLAEGDFGNSYIDGTIVDYVTGNARITTGPIDDMTFYHGGTSGRSEMMRLSYAGNSYIVGNLGVGTITNPDGLLTLPAAASNTPKIRLQSATSDVDVTISSYADSSGTYAAFGSNFYLNSSGDEAVFDSAKRSSFVRVDGRSQGAVIFGTAASGVPSERMRITSAGDVLVGGTSNSFYGNSPKLTVVGGTSPLAICNGDNSGTFLRFDTGVANGIITINANARTGNYPPLAFQTADTERMRIDTSGRVTMPFQPAFDVYASGAVTQNQVWVGNNALVNIGSCYNTSTGVFTAPVAGTYKFSFNGLPQGTGDMGIRVNGTQRTTCRGSGTTAACNLIVTLAANDQVTAYINAGAQFYSDNNGWSTFTGQLIG